MEKVIKQYGEGTEYILKDGRYGIALSLGVDEETRKRIRLVGTGMTAERAKASLAKKLDALRLSQGIVSEEEVRLTITGVSLGEDFVEEYVRNRVIPRIGNEISSRTANDYILYLDKFKEYSRGNMVSKLEGVSFLNGFFKEMTEARNEKGDYKYGPVAMGRSIMALKPMFERAKARNFIRQNPFEDMDFVDVKSKKEKTEVGALQNEELIIILSIIKKNDVLYTLIRLMLVTGMRTEETVALTWENIDFINRRISIEKVVTLDYLYDIKGELQSVESIIAKTKTERSKRVVAVDETTIGLLEKWREWADTNTKTDTRLEGFVFGNTTSPRWTCCGLRSSIKKCLVKGGYKGRFGLHQLRHNVGTMLGEDGRSIIQIMQQLGHTQTSTALRYISHTDIVAQENCCSIQNKLIEAGI